MPTDSTSDERRRLVRRKFIGTVGAGIVGGLAGCSGGEEEPEPTPEPTTTSDGGDGSDGTPTSTPDLMERADPPDEIVFTDFPITGMEQVYYAQEKGLFEKRGLNVRVTDSPIFGGGSGLSAVIAGDAHVASTVSSPGPINLAREQDVWFRMLFPDSVQNPDTNSVWVVVAEDSGIESYADLAGGTVGIHSGGPGLIPISARWNAANAGLDPFEDISLQTVPLPQIGGAVARGDVDAGFWFEPRVANAMANNLPIKRLMPGHGWLIAEGSGTPDGFWVRDEFYQEYPATTRLIQNTLAEVRQHARDGNDDFFRIAAERLEVSNFKELMDQGYLYEPSTFEGANPIESLQKTQTNLLRYTQIGTPIEVERLLLPWNQP